MGIGIVPATWQQQREEEARQAIAAERTRQDEEVQPQLSASLTKQIARQRAAEIGMIEDDLQRELAELRQRHAQERVSFDEEMAKLRPEFEARDAAFAELSKTHEAERAAIAERHRRDAAKREADQVRRLQEEIEDERIAAMEDGSRRAVAELAARHRRELAEAERLGATTAVLQALRERQAAQSSGLAARLAREGRVEPMATGRDVRASGAMEIGSMSTAPAFWRAVTDPAREQVDQGKKMIGIQQRIAAATEKAAAMKPEEYDNWRARVAVVSMQ